MELELAGRRMPAILDTQASSGFAVTPAFAESLPFASPPAAVGRVRLARSTPGPVPAPPSLRGFGLSAPHAEDGVRRIAHVLPGSPADKGGVKAGDEVVAADGGPAGELTEAQFTALADLGRPVRFRLRRAGAEREVSLAPVVQVR